MYNLVVVEISGKCNAFCKWCVTGRANRCGQPSDGGFLDPELLRKAIAHMHTEGLIKPYTVFSLYNWGEPFLHPRFQDIVSVLTEAGHEFIISSNLSHFVSFDEPYALKNLRAVVISMPGFSQRSYDKIHGFSFGKIKSNIIKMIKNYRSHGFKGKIQIKPHIYQFNLDEFQDLFTFAKTFGIGIDPTFATFADLNLLMEYVEKKLPEDELYAASQDLLLGCLTQYKGSMPSDFDCPYYDALILDEECNIVTCCMVTKKMDDFIIGNLFKTKTTNIDTLKRGQSICRQCLKLEIPYLIQQRSFPNFMHSLDLPLPIEAKERDIVVWGAGKMANDLRIRMEQTGQTKCKFISDHHSTQHPEIPSMDLIGPEVITNSPRPFVIIANEYIYPCIESLKKNGYKHNFDYKIKSIVNKN